MLLVAILAVCAITSDGASITNSEANRASRMMLSIVDDNAGNIHPWRGDKGYQVQPACSGFHTSTGTQDSRMRIPCAVPCPGASNDSTECLGISATESYSATLHGLPSLACVPLPVGVWLKQKGNPHSCRYTMDFPISQDSNPPSQLSQ